MYFILGININPKQYLDLHLNMYDVVYLKKMQW